MSITQPPGYWCMMIPHPTLQMLTYNNSPPHPQDVDVWWFPTALQMLMYYDPPPHPPVWWSPTPPSRCWCMMIPHHIMYDDSPPHLPRCCCMWRMYRRSSFWARWWHLVTLILSARMLLGRVRWWSSFWVCGWFWLDCAGELVLNSDLNRRPQVYSNHSIHVFVGLSTPLAICLFIRW